MSSTAVCERCNEHLKLENPCTERTNKCTVCLGIFNKANLARNIQKAITTALEPYGGSSENRISVKICPPTVALPGDVAYRYQLLQSDRSDPVVTFGQRIKQHVKRVVSRCLERDLVQKSSESFPKAIQDEELGYLCLHIVLTPSKEVYRPDHELPRPKQSIEGRKKKLCNDLCSQGGNPPLNFEIKLQRQGYSIWPLNSAIDKNFTYSDQDLQRLAETPDGNLLEVHVAAWRRQFYIKGCYSKARRDISQTPFFVTNGGKRQKLGSTSVEEAIAPAIIKACGGLSSLNNDDALVATVFGMAKFHASGREDMDVRMLLPDPPIANVTGRPFVFEIYDAFRLPSVDALQSISREVNCFDGDNSTPQARSYGRNPNGVGISSDLRFVPSIEYKNLQADTETKVKHYGCLCWSAAPHKNIEELTAKLGSYPINVNQQTPIRVLHRRANAVRSKQVLYCQVTEYIDEHYFRLHLRTSAGTYVKEFVHGDLGRTVPSISSLLGCTTDILELDCEGIQMS